MFSQSAAPSAGAPVTTPSGTELSEALFRVSKRLRSLCLEGADSSGIPPGQGMALRIIAKADHPLRVADLADRLSIAPRSATDVADSLERAGLVSRRPSTDDRRVVLLSLTPEGTAASERIDAAVRVAGERLFGRLDPSDQAELLRLLRTVLDLDAG